MPVAVDEDRQRDDERPYEVPYTVGDHPGDVRKERRRDALVVNDGRRDESDWCLRQDSDSPTEADSDGDHPLVEVIPVRHRIHDLDVTFGGDEDNAGDRAIQSAPDEHLASDELSQKVVSDIARSVDALHELNRVSDREK